MPPEAIEKLERSLDAWGGEYDSELYPAKHGWMIAGREVHHPEQAQI
jgi:hypothetical protein